MTDFIPDAYRRRWQAGRAERQRARPAPGEGGRTAADEARTSYYGVPVVHKPHWKWLIVVYFFLGGIAGASYLIAAVAHLFGPPEDRALVRTARYVSFAALLPCPFLLILDLGKPSRFYTMLRVLKLRSPMSVGTWGLTAFGAVSTLSTLQQAAQDGLLGRGTLARFATRLPAGAIGTAGTPFALFVSGYTGVLLAATAVPLWAKRPLLVGPLFLCSACSTAASTVALVLSLFPGTRAATLRRLSRFERIALVAELATLLSWLVRLGPTAKPLTSGPIGGVVRYGTIGGGLLGPLALQLLDRHLPIRMVMPTTRLSSLLVLAGGFALRYAIVVAGAASADDSDATFDLTRVRDSTGSTIAF